MASGQCRQRPVWRASTSPSRRREAAAPILRTMGRNDDMDDAYSLTTSREGRGLRAVVRGERTLANTIAYWEALLEEIDAQRPQWLFLCDRLVGHELSAEDWYALVKKMTGRGLEGIRIAHVKPSGMDHLEYCEIFAREAGIDARAFSDAGVAERWLRYGTDEDVA